MPELTQSLYNLAPREWYRAVQGPVSGVLMTGDEDFYYVWSQGLKPTLLDSFGHYVKRYENEYAVVPEGSSLWVRPSHSPMKLTLSIAATQNQLVNLLLGWIDDEPLLGWGDNEPLTF